MMPQLASVFLVLALVFTLVNAGILRWIFRINRMVELLESIDESLQQLPAVRDARRYEAKRRAA